MELNLKEQPVELKQFLNVNKIILNDIDIYDQETGELVICFKKNVIPKELYNIDNKLIKYASAYSNNRGDAAGITNVKDLQMVCEETYDVNSFVKDILITAIKKENTLEITENTNK